jgi:hypothetical protein
MNFNLGSTWARELLQLDAGSARLRTTREENRRRRLGYFDNSMDVMRIFEVISLR